MMKTIQASATALALAPARARSAATNFSSRAFRRARKHDRRATQALALVAVMLATSSPAFAQAAGGGTAITSFLQNLVDLITGTTGQLLSVLAICVVGVGALFGGLSMRTAGGVVLGVAILFSASWFVGEIVA